ncbi:MAG: ABC transporter ATP-binding protein, partial [bacterium]|nr:ABC transporter ATP-binding protein [bacterium]
PHMSVQQNVAFGLQMRKVPAAERERQVDQALQLVRLQELGKRMPRELSGGQQQRVALARALVVKPDALLLDEPLSNLDAKLRTEVRIEIRQLQQRLGLTAVFVTHDQEEALTIADRLVVMSNGVIQQVGTPEELYEQPRNRFVADFIGKSNFFTGTIETPSCFRTTTGVRIAFGPNGAPSHGEVVLAVRPEKIAVVGEAPASAPNAFPARVELVTYLGARSEYLLRLETGEQLIVHTQNTRDESRRFAAAGAPCHVVWDPLDSLILAPISSAQAEDSHAS